MSGLHRLLLAVVWLAGASTCLAHRLDEYLQATFVVIEPCGVKVQMLLTPGTAVMMQVLATLDANSDDVISPQEAAAYAEQFKRDLTVRLDEHDVALKLTASDFPTPAELRTGLDYIQMEFTVEIPGLTAGPHKLRLENRHFKNTGAYLINAAKPKAATIQIIRQKRNDNQSEGEIEFAFAKAAQG